MLTQWNKLDINGSNEGKYLLFKYEFNLEGPLNNRVFDLK